MKTVTQEQKVKNFVKEHRTIILSTGIALATGVLFGGSITYKKGFDVGMDTILDNIVAVSVNNGHLLMTNRTFGDYMFKATKVLSD